MRRLSILPVLALCAGCVSEAQHLRVRNRLGAEEDKNRRMLERVTALDTHNLLLQAKLAKAGIKLQESDMLRAAMENQMKWPGITGAELGPEGELIVEDKLLFKPGSHALLPQGKLVLAQVADALVKSGAALIRVDGHTDTDRIDKSRRKYSSNFHLSAMRALSVLEYLQSRGVPGKKIYLAGFGQFKPRASDKAGNRRVEIRAFK